MNEDAVVKLAQLESKFDSFSDAMTRIERVLERTLSRAEANDVAVRELVLQQQYTQERLSEVRRATEQCSDAHRAANEAMVGRLTMVHDRQAALENKSAGAMKVVVWFCGIFSSVLIGTSSWAFNQITENGKAITIQQQHIERLKYDVAELKADARAGK